ncbi:MAG TPA: pyrroline-5-carboxylate reductase [bacterium]|nr:pyrroline-5-carboxylate reductase [bacterium]HOL47483.1 pyrroline-5-carboxylate reductase [bacterium]HPQ18608.1 pyrroline-5-carboxylate reductase [bacterium]
MSEKRIGFIGCGNMATAILENIIGNQIIKRNNLIIYDIIKDKTEYFNNKYKIEIAKDNSDLIQKADIIFLAIKPQSLNDLEKEIKNNNFAEKCIVSIMAGIKTDKLSNIFKNAQIVRTMPNTPALVSEGMTGIYFKNINEQNKEIIINIFSSIGDYVIVQKEEILNLITAISGSGPAYIFYIIEAIEEAICEINKFSDSEKIEGRKIILQTIKGAIKLIEETKEEPEKLRKKVTSRKGTTEAAINEFEKKELKEIIKEGIKAAYKRAIELGEELSK